ncbi:hypothetical protein ElyMa_005641800 [Elysia marginata]|uniref:Uncharacterized protein n=1 Tax=Elysia marginata TaxID=1093978 RepID=A0AAV4F9Y9_9GAST|nr:hypothetical protein ElyMa_005641800 [Elysia marginata]
MTCGEREASKSEEGGGRTCPLSVTRLRQSFRKVFFAKRSFLVRPLSDTEVGGDMAARAQWEVKGAVSGIVNGRFAGQKSLIVMRGLTGFEEETAGNHGLAVGEFPTSYIPVTVDLNKSN